MPKSVLSRRRSWVARLAVLALIASTLVVGAVPASASAPQNPATYSACVGPATASAGFADTAGNFAASDINCIKYYGVTQGTTATTFSPSQVVTRWQMALFLTRAAGPAGITLPDGSDQGFTDIGHLDAATQKAINQLKQLGITQGTSATTFSPDAPVTRAQMALFIGRFLNAAVTGPGGTPWTSASTTHLPGFTDIGNLTVEAYNSVVKLWNLGVTTGTSATTFSPTAPVTRAQMAAFIARALAHTNARPAGVTIQAVPASIFSGSNVNVAVSVRDSSFQPVANALVDVFQAPANQMASAIKSDGTCDTSVTSATFGATECTIDVADPNTDANGNITATLTALTSSTVWWAWTGSVGATFDADTTQFSTAQVTVNPAPNAVRWTSSSPANAQVGTGTPGAGLIDGVLTKYGTAVTYTAQIVDSLGNPVALAGVEVSIVYDRYVGNTFTGSTTVKATTDATGKAVFTFVENDPSSTADNSTTYDVTNRLNDQGLTDDPSALIDEDIVWDDNASQPATLTVSAGKRYSAGTSQTAIATVYDQYGLGLPGVTVTFRTDDLDGDHPDLVTTFTAPLNSLGTTVNRTTGPGGTAAQVITVSSSTNGFDEVTAQVSGLPDAEVVIYWVDELADNGSSGGAQTVLVWDADADTLVFWDGTNYVFVEYDANDQLTLSSGPASFDDFDKAVAAEPAAGTHSQVTVNNYKQASTGISQITLS